MPNLFSSSLLIPPRRHKASLLFSERELPGRYCYGLGWNASLILSANRRYKYVHSGCMGVDERNWGKWDLDGDRLRLISERYTIGDIPPEIAKKLSPKEVEEFYDKVSSGIPSRMNTCFIPVQWEKRIYLVDEYYMPAFCQRASIRTGYEAILRNQMQPVFEYLKFPANKPHAYEVQQAYPPLNPNSRPLLPVRYRTFYEQGPIRVKVVRILPPLKQQEIPANVARVLLSKGTSSRVKPGLLLATTQEDSYATLIVTAVRSGESEAARVDLSDAQKDTIRVGDVFSSGEYNCDVIGSRSSCLPEDTRTVLPQWATALREAWNR